MTSRHQPPIVLLLALALIPFAACGGGGGAAPGPAFPQTLTSIEPGEGTTAGGTLVTLRGSGFEDPDHEIFGIRIGNKQVSEWEIVDDTRITLVTPPGALGLEGLWIFGANSEYGDGILLAAGFRYVAPVLYAADGPEAVGPQLYRIDLDTGSSQLVGPTGIGVQALARAPDGQLWGVERGPLFRLIRIDPASAVATPVALLHLDGTEDPVDLQDLAFLGTRLIGRTQDEQLVEIGLEFGEVTPRATVPSAGPAAGIAPTGTGRLYLAPSGPPGFLSTWDEGLDNFQLFRLLVTPDLITAMTRSAGVLYGCVQGPMGPLLVRIDPSTGAVDPVAMLPAAVRGIARDR